MLLKYSQYEKRSKLLSNKPLRTTGGMKLMNGKGKGYRKGVRYAASKRLNNPRSTIGCKKEDVSPMAVDPCDSSNDSGLGFEHLELSSHRVPTAYTSLQEYCWGSDEISKKRRYDEVKHESDNANDNFTFLPSVVQRQPSVDLPLCRLLEERGRGGGGCESGAASGRLGAATAVSGGGGGRAGSGSSGGLKTASGGRGSLNSAATSASAGLSRNGKIQLEILAQPEVQHRARYQTEGSRGAVKDRSGNSFPIVKLTGYGKPATLEVYIGTDQGRVAPHMFYQACRVSGKNSTPCLEKKVDGTVLIEIEMDPTKDMTVTCDCVGILKERNVDVEHRFPEESTGRSKKKSTRCRMVFRTTITHDDGSVETLQVTSQPIICTQPPGIPEICKKSLTACPASGGLELFILGKNFLKDTQVLFSEGEPGTELYWESSVYPDKEFLQQSHLVCAVPPYRNETIREMVAVRLMVTSSGRSSEPHTFVYTPVNALPLDPNAVVRAAAQNMGPSTVFPSPPVIVGGVPWHLPIQPTSAPTFIQEEPPKIEPAAGEPLMDGIDASGLWPSSRQFEPMVLEDTVLCETKEESEMMPPPAAVPPPRRSSDVVKREVESPPDLTTAALTGFESALPSLAVESFLSRLESSPSQEEQLQQQQVSHKPELLPALLSQPPPVSAPQQLSPVASQPSLPAPSQATLSGLLGESSSPLLAPSNLLFPTGESLPPGPALIESGRGGEGVVGEAVSSSGGYGSLVFTEGTLPGGLTLPGSTGSSEGQTLALSAVVSTGQSLSLGGGGLSLAAPTQPSPLLAGSQPPPAAPGFPSLMSEPLPPKPLELAPRAPVPPPQKKPEEGLPPALSQELNQMSQELSAMSEHDLLSYINPSCFDQGNPPNYSQFFI